MKKAHPSKSIYDSMSRITSYDGRYVQSNPIGLSMHPY